MIFLIQASNSGDLNLQKESQFNKKMESIFSKNNSEYSKNSENETLELEELTQLALKEKSVDELKISALKNGEFLDDNLKKDFSETLDKIQSPRDFSNSVNNLPDPSVSFIKLSQHNNRGWTGRGWYCVSNTYGAFGPHSDFWISAIVCAWADGKLFWMDGNYCFSLNYSGLYQ